MNVCSVMQRGMARTTGSHSETTGPRVRAVEEAVREVSGGGGTPEPDQIDGAGLAPLTRLRPPGLLELEKLLADRLETRVSINMTAKRGRVTIDFADLPDLERIYRAMIGEGS